LLRKEDKNGAIWLYGAPNSGKTTILKYLKEIFEIVPFVQTKSKFDLQYN